MSNPKILCLPPIANTLRDLYMRFTWVFPIERFRTDSRHYFIDKWTIRPRGKTDAPSGPSIGISLRHMDFLSANGARARPWQNTVHSYANLPQRPLYSLFLKGINGPHHWKTLFCYMRATKENISLHIWSAPMLLAY